MISTKLQGRLAVVELVHQGISSTSASLTSGEWNDDVTMCLPTESWCGAITRHAEIYNSNAVRTNKNYNHQATKMTDKLMKQS
jgi:hypothetical protein